MEYLALFIAGIFTKNILLNYFLGMCPFLAVSGNIKTATSMGAAVTFVMMLTVAITWPLNYYILVPNQIEYLQFPIFIAVIASLVQVVELVIERSSPILYINLGVFLPLIVVNCAIFGLALFVIVWEYTYMQSLAYGIGAGLGWLLAIVAMAGIRTKLRFSNVPRALEGPGITAIIAGIMGLAFTGLLGIVDV
jgi:Na+-transporting NADH:ubiquinone oxidoreductase subunit E